MAASPSSPVTPKEYIASNVQFSISIYREYALVLPRRNFVLCPFALEAIISIIQAGAKGDTGKELRSVISQPDDPREIETRFRTLIPILRNNEAYTIAKAFKVYYKTGITINEEYEAKVRNVFQSEIEEIDFIPEKEAAATINSWMIAKTENKINNVVESLNYLNEKTRLVLVNALLFKASWSNQFNPRNTLRKHFLMGLGTPIDALFMHETSYYYYHESKEIKATFLKLSFGRGAYFIVVLPTDVEGAENLEEQPEKLFIEPQWTREEVYVVLPKFKLHHEVDCVDILRTLGVERAFTRELADFGGISEASAEEIYISNILQECSVEVDETGIQAAAAYYMCSDTSSPHAERPPPKRFVADHPFIFYIKVKDLILFVGKVVVPFY